MIETILVALENSLNLVGVVRHYQCFVISVSPGGSEPGGRTGKCDLDALLLAALQDVSRFYPFRYMICGQTSADPVRELHLLIY
jgi:hypothetical protein